MSFPLTTQEELFQRHYLIFLSTSFHFTEFTRICVSWKTETWLWFRIFLTDMIIYQVKSAGANRPTYDLFLKPLS